MAFTTQEISNHPRFTDVERTVSVIGFELNDIAKIFTLRCTVGYTRDGADISAEFNQKVYDVTASNRDGIIQRDVEGEPIWGEDGKPVEIPGYDYVTGLLTQPSPVSLRDVVNFFIELNDGYKLFDQ